MTKQERLEAMYDKLDAVIDTFQWGQGDHIYGDVRVDRSTNKLCLARYVLNNDNPDPEAELFPLEARGDIDPYREPRHQIRDLIHWYLCHEADEQMFFDGEMVFDPHQREVGKVRPKGVHH